MIQVVIQDHNINNILRLIQNGLIQFPKNMFRPFNLILSEQVNVLNSIINGYPIGIITTWCTNEQLETCSPTDLFNFPKLLPNNNTEYVLDGRNRLIIILNAFGGVGNCNFYYDLDSQKVFEKYKVDDDAILPYQIALTDINNPKIFHQFGKSYTKSNKELYQKRWENVSLILQKYTVPFQHISNIEMEVALKIKMNLSSEI